LLVGGYQYRYRTPEDYEALQTGSESRFFTSIGQNFYINGGASGDDYVLVYHQMFPALSGDSDTNWLTTNAPETYLWAALRHASIYTLDDAAMSKFATLYAGAVQRVNKREQAARYAGPLEMVTYVAGAV